MNAYVPTTFDRMSEPFQDWETGQRVLAVWFRRLNEWRVRFADGRVAHIPDEAFMSRFSELPNGAI